MKLLSAIYHNFFRLFIHPLLYLVYLLSHLSLRDRKTWVFGMRQRFEGNGKYLFLSIVNSRQADTRVAWISRNKEIVKELQAQGYPAFYWRSWQGIFYPLRAKYFIFDSSVGTISYWLSGRAKKINLYHGVFLKKIEQDIEKESISGIRRIMMRIFMPWRFEKPDYVLNISPLFKKIFMSAFRVQDDQIITAGYPRNDVFFKEIRGAEIGADKSFLSQTEDLRKKNPKFILYAPTFRDTERDSFINGLLELGKFDEFFREHNLVLLIKLHFVDHKAYLSRWSKTAPPYKNIRFVAPGPDFYPFLKYMDILITDYSSIYLDFLLFDRPVIFFPFDYEKYVTKDRAIYFNYDEMIAGPKAYTYDELINIIKSVAVDGEDKWKEKRARMLKLSFTDPDGESSARFVELLKDINN